MSIPESLAPVNPSLLPKFQSLLALHEPNTPLDAPGPHFDALRELPPSELSAYLNWATHLPPEHQPVSQPSHGPSPLTLDEYVARLRDLHPLDAGRSCTFALHTQSTIGGTKPPEPLTLGVRHAADGQEAGRIALRSQRCPWSIQDAREIDPRGDVGRRDDLLRLGVAADIPPGTRAGTNGVDRVGVYLGELVESHDGGVAWHGTAGHLFLAVDATFSPDLDSPIFVVRDRTTADGSGTTKAGGRATTPPAGAHIVLPREPAVPTIAELVRDLHDAAQNDQKPAPTALQAALALEEGEVVSAWVVRDEDLVELGLKDNRKLVGNGLGQHEQVEAKANPEASTHQSKSILSKVGGIFHKHQK